MNDKSLGEKAAVQLDTGTRLAFERTFLAYERTQMAWVRTALSLISFGFGIAKFFDFLHQKQGDLAPVLGGRTVGQIMIGVGLVSLLLAEIQRKRAMQALRKQCPDLPRSLAGVTAGLIALLGLLALIGAIIRQV